MSRSPEFAATPDYTQNFIEIFAYQDAIDIDVITARAISERSDLYARYTELMVRGHTPVSAHDIVRRDEHLRPALDASYESKVKQDQNFLAKKLENVGLKIDQDAGCGLTIDDALFFTRALSHTAPELLEFPADIHLKTKLSLLMKDFLDHTADSVCAYNIDTIITDMNIPQDLADEIPAWLGKNGYAVPELTIFLHSGAPSQETITTLLRCSPSILESMKRICDLENQRQFSILRTANDDSLLVEWAMAYKMEALQPEPAYAARYHPVYLQTLLAQLDKKAPQANFTIGLRDRFLPYIAAA